MLNQAEQQNFIILCRKLGLGGEWPYAVFRELSLVMVTTSIEVVIFRMRDGKIQVLLTKRHEEDPDWPGGSWHIAGTVLRKEDVEGDQDAIRRVIHEELGDIHIDHPQFVGLKVVQTKRGPTNEHIYIGTAAPSYDPPVGQFFDIENLPSPFVEHQYEVLRIALARFLNTRAPGS